MEILIVEDDQVLGKAIRKGLAESGHECTWTRSGAKGLEAALRQWFDCIVLDLMLPDTPGLEVLSELRAKGQRSPVIVLTALGAVDDRVRGLDAGADDYLVKPFAFAEFLARVNAVARRSTARPATLLQVGPLELDLARHRVSRDGAEIELTPTEFSLLEYLLRNAGQVVTRKMLCEHLWQADWEGVTNVVEVHINRLRNKIDKGFEPTLIQTVRGRGYVIPATA